MNMIIFIIYHNLKLTKINNNNFNNKTKIISNNYLNNVSILIMKKY